MGPRGSVRDGERTGKELYLTAPLLWWKHLAQTLSLLSPQPHPLLSLLSRAAPQSCLQGMLTDSSSLWPGSVVFPPGTQSRDREPQALPPYLAAHSGPLGSGTETCDSARCGARPWAPSLQTACCCSWKQREQHAEFPAPGVQSPGTSLWAPKALGEKSREGAQGELPTVPRGSRHPPTIQGCTRLCHPSAFPEDMPSANWANGHSPQAILSSPAAAPRLGLFISQRASSFLVPACPSADLPAVGRNTSLLFPVLLLPSLFPSPDPRFPPPRSPRLHAVGCLGPPHPSSAC